MTTAKWRSPLVSAAVVLLLTAGCVPANAGYDDVRDITSAHLGKDVRWHERQSGKKADAETKRLLGSPLTPDAAVQIALYNNEALQAAFEELGIARGRLVHALRLPNPTVGAALRYGAADRPEIDIDATLSLSELLFMPWRNGVAQAELDAKKLEIAAKAVDLAFETRSTFFDYQAAGQKLELRRTVLESLRASLDMAERLHDAGNITDLALASERSFYEEARIAYARAEAAFAAEREKLNALMGVWGPSAARWTAVENMPEPAPVEPLLENIEAKVVSKSLDLALFRRRFEQAARRANLSRVEGWVPELRAGVSAERQEADWGVGPLAELEVPLLYQGQGETAVALSEMRQQRKLFADTAVRLRARARAAASELSVTAESVRYYRTTLLPLRKKVLEETQLQYNAMNAGVFQLLQAKRDQIAAAQGYVDLLHDYWTLRTVVDQLLAGRLPAGESGMQDLGMDVAPVRGMQDRH